MGSGLIESILELKKRCPIIDTIGNSLQLSEREIEAVNLVGKSGLISSKELSGQMDLSPSRGSRVINRLVEEGIFRSEPSDSDKRYHRISLTPRGQEHFAQLEREKRECEEFIFSQLNGEERVKVEEGLRILAELFERDRAGGINGES